MKKIVATVVAGAAASAVGLKWMKNRGSRGLGDSVSTVKDTANRVKERIRPSADADSEPSDDPATEASDAPAAEASDDEAVEASDDEAVEPALSKA